MKILHNTYGWIHDEKPEEGEEYLKAHGGKMVNGELVGYGSHTAIYTEIIEPELPKLQLHNFTVKSNGSGMTKAGNIYWTDLDTPFEITSSVTDESGVIASLNTSLGKTDGDSTNFIVMLERVVKQENGTITVVGDLRVAATVTATEMTINSTKGFSVSGNYVVTAERLNKGLDEIGAQFRIDMETLEFDVLNG